MFLNFYVDKTLVYIVTIQMKANEQYFHVILFVLISIFSKMMFLNFELWLFMTLGSEKVNSLDIQQESLFAGLFCQELMPIAAQILFIFPYHSPFLSASLLGAFVHIDISPLPRIHYLNYHDLLPSGLVAQLVGATVI